MTKLDDLEIRVRMLEKKMFPNVFPAPDPDPYLVPGAACEMWDEDKRYRQLMYYVGEINGEKMFKPTTNYVAFFNHSHYRVLGTVWDHAPDWAEWVATDEEGSNYFCEIKPKRSDPGWGLRIGQMIQVGYADPSDWQNSLRRRPEWARRTT
jgi:hypothetical protein